MYTHGELRMQELEHRWASEGMPIEERARRMFEVRNDLREWARTLMADHDGAARLNATEKMMTWEQLVEKTTNRGFAGDRVFQEIIESSTRSRPSVNAQLGIDPHSPPPLPPHQLHGERGGSPDPMQERAGPRRVDSGAERSGSNHVDVDLADSTTRIGDDPTRTGGDGSDPPPTGRDSHPGNDGQRPDWVQRFVDGDLDLPTDPDRLRELWDHLDGAERTDLFRQDPMFGDRAQLPVTVCDEFARDALAHWRERMPDDPMYRSIEEATQQQLDEPRRYLLGFDPDGRSITSVGNPDTATHTAIFVPGTFTDATKLIPGPDHPGYMEVGRRFQDEADAHFRGRGQVAVVDWQNYHAPQSLLPEAARHRFAEAGAPELRGFLDRLAHTSEHVGQHRTVIGHSYGATVVGLAAHGPGLNAHGLISLGGAGMHASSVTDLLLQGVPLKPGSAPVWSLMHPNDPIRFVEPFDRTPLSHGRMTHREDFGGHVVWIDDRIGPLWKHFEMEAHSAYWELRSQSLRIIGEIIAGLW